MNLKKYSQVRRMTELSESQKIKVIKAILDDEIDTYIKAKQHYDEGTKDYTAIFVRGDTLITLREKLKILKEFQEN